MAQILWREFICQGVIQFIVCTLYTERKVRWFLGATTQHLTQSHNILPKATTSYPKPQHLTQSPQHLTQSNNILPEAHIAHYSLECLHSYATNISLIVEQNISDFSVKKNIPYSAVQHRFLYIKSSVLVSGLWNCLMTLLKMGTLSFTTKNQFIIWSTHLKILTIGCITGWWAKHSIIPASVEHSLFCSYTLYL